MGEQEIIDRVIKVVREQLQPKDMTDEQILDAHFANVLKADSLDSVELVMELDGEFGITIPDEEVPRLSTARLVVEYVKRELAKKK